MIFSRRRGNAGRHGRQAGRSAKHSRGRDDATAMPAEEFEDFDDAPVLPDFGPYDISAAPDDGVHRLDLGSMRVPALADVEIRLQAGPDGQIQQVLLAHGESRLQLAAFAAPRTEGIWDEMRADLRASLVSSSVKLEEIDGDYGPELRARVKDAGGAADLRFVGVDGPRWCVQGVYRGAAAVDPNRAGPLRDVLRGLVVDRGAQAMPVSEALPLRLPPEAAEQLGRPLPMAPSPTSPGPSRPARPSPTPSSPAPSSPTSPVDLGPTGVPGDPPAPVSPRSTGRAGRKTTAKRRGR